MHAASEHPLADEVDAYPHFLLSFAVYALHDVCFIAAVVPKASIVEQLDVFPGKQSEAPDTKPHYEEVLSTYLAQFKNFSISVDPMATYVLHPARAEQAVPAEEIYEHEALLALLLARQNFNLSVSLANALSLPILISLQLRAGLVQFVLEVDAV